MVRARHRLGWRAGAWLAGAAGWCRAGAGEGGDEVLGIHAIHSLPPVGLVPLEPATGLVPVGPLSRGSDPVVTRPAQNADPPAPRALRSWWPRRFGRPGQQAARAGWCGPRCVPRVPSPWRRPASRQSLVRYSWPRPRAGARQNKSRRALRNPGFSPMPCPRCAASRDRPGWLGGALAMAREARRRQATPAMEFPARRSVGQQDTIRRGQ